MAYPIRTQKVMKKMICMGIEILPNPTWEKSLQSMKISDVEERLSELLL